MISKIKLIILLVAASNLSLSQEKAFDVQLFQNYDEFKEVSLNSRRIKHKDLQPLINALKVNPAYLVKQVGKSIEGRDLTLISLGTGDIDVFLWSQMHGDEPTATQSIFDIFNFFNGDLLSPEKQLILSRLKIHFLPMLNPDGAEIFERRNALGIDINRDALRLQSPESKTLKRVRDSLDADIGFNLHDQSRYYNAEGSEKTATISYLAPAYNIEKDINKVRGRAMKLIVVMNASIQKFAKGQVGRYNDAFEPRAFGDNIQKWGTSTILIESGGYKNDIEKQEIRKLNFVSILTAFYSLATGSYKDVPLENYDSIPWNDRKLFDLKIEGLNYELLGQLYKLDLGVNQLEVGVEDNSDFYNVGRIMDKGDLSTFYGYESLNAEDYKVTAGKIYPEVLKDMDDLKTHDVFELLSSGYLFVRLKKLPKSPTEAGLPINVLATNEEAPELNINLGSTPNFFLEKNGRLDYAIINGFLIDLRTKKTSLRNAQIYRD